MAERGGKPSISIYDLTTLKKKNILGQLTETAAQEYVSLSFSFDGKFLAAILGDPDWTLIYFQWEKGKIDSTTKARNPTTSGQVTQVKTLNNAVTHSLISDKRMSDTLSLSKKLLSSRSFL